MSTTATTVQSKIMKQSEHGLTTYNDRSLETSEHAEDVFLEQQTKWVPRDPVESSLRAATLKKPVVIPRIAINSLLQSPLPFLRAYSPELRPHHVYEKEFVAFIDNLTVVQTAPAPLQAMNAIGTGIGIVPYHWAKAVEVGLSVVAIAGSKIITKKRTSRYLEAVNNEYFAPRGLKVALYKDTELAALIKYPESQLDLASADSDSTLNTIHNRRMLALAPYIAPLSTDVPPPVLPQNMLDKFSAKQIARKMKKQEKKASKNYEKTASRKQKRQGSKKQEKKALKKALKKQGQSGEEARQEVDRAEADYKDSKKLKRMEYIVVENLS